MRLIWNESDILNELKRNKLILSRNIMPFAGSTLVEKKILSYGVKGITKKPVSIDDLQAILDGFKALRKY